MTIPEEDVFFPIHPLCADIWKFAFIHGFKKVVQYSLKVSLHIELYSNQTYIYKKYH